jgi:hypothetical protein
MEKAATPFANRTSCNYDIFSQSCLNAYTASTQLYLDIGIDTSNEVQRGMFIKQDEKWILKAIESGYKMLAALKRNWSRGGASQSDLSRLSRFETTLGRIGGYIYDEYPQMWRTSFDASARRQWDSLAFVTQVSGGVESDRLWIRFIPLHGPGLPARAVSTSWLCFAHAQSG